jgi:hypothetical protein
MRLCGVREEFVGFVTDGYDYGTSRSQGGHMGGGNGWLVLAYILQWMRVFAMLGGGKMYSMLTCHDMVYYSRWLYKVSLYDHQAQPLLLRMLMK